MAIKSFKELIIWQRSMELAEEIYHLTDQLPKSERFGIVAQMRRSAVSIPSNIAEGKERRTRKDFMHFLHIAKGSTSELETQMLLVSRIFKDIDIKKSLSLLNEVNYMMISFMKTLR